MAWWALIHHAQSPKAISDTKALIKTAHDKHLVENLLNVQTQQLGHALLQHVEQTKIRLSQHPQTTVNLDSLGFGCEITAHQSTFLDGIQNHLSGIHNALDECLTQSGCSATDIGLVILTGGTSELPIINKMVRKTFPNADISNEDKFGSVGRGLAYSSIAD